MRFRTKLAPALLLLLLAGGRPQAQAQQQCPTIALGQMVTQFSQWDWTVAPSHADYCRNWTVRRPNTGIAAVNAPWVKPATTSALELQIDKDYTREKGWELLRMDFGAQTAIQTPYFALYNKYTSVIRVFFYMDNSQGTYTNGALISMTNTPVGSSRISSVSTLANNLLKSSDTYQQGTAGGAEVMTYVAEMPAVSCWVMGEFNMGYDPMIGSSVYRGSALRFELQGITRSTVDLKGSMEWKTDAQEGYGVTGKKSAIVSDVQAPTNNNPATGVKNFLVQGQKVLGKVSKKDVDKFLEQAAQKAQKAKDLFAVGSTASSTKLKVADQIIKLAGEGSKLPGTIKKIAEIAGGANIAFGILGSVIGFLWPSDDESTPQAPTFIPTVSTGTLALAGTITTTYPLASVLMQTPGSQHLGDGSTEPYYDCGLGLFTLKNTPVLNQKSFHNGDLMSYFPSFRMYSSYQVANDLIPSYNKAAGLRLLSTQAAIVVEDPLPLPTSFLSSSVPDGDIVAADDKKVTYQSEFVDLSCFKNMTLTTNERLGAAGYRVFVRVKAILQRENAPLLPPIYFVQDYEVQVNQNAAATNPGFDPNSNYTVAPYSNIPEPLNSGYEHYAREGVNAVPVLTYDGYLSEGKFEFPFPTVTIGTTVFPGSAPGAVMAFDHPQTTTTSYIMASEGAIFGPGFSVARGTSFVATTSLLAYRNQLFCGGPVVPDPTVVPCAYNSAAWRAPTALSQVEAKASGPQLSVYPNPSTGEVTVVTDGTGENAALEVYDSFGRQIQRIPQLPAGKREQKVNLSGLAPGIYIIRLQLRGNSLSQKVVLQ
ncbi:T9SS type A sorting domain-containing protein [Hymenobacter aquaticus]|uniref:T9SS type A sorting domain-containing protein n=1 Tax=Hymenobacter aquaticus TaxID=1867101 RepID=A0A4Z0PSQ0_9BACT|nr:T9SS type A sorting domain-containing protein [Hymenobacter aquaticus]TGE20767.1 T9SS type A sorting domain-containing protein [Hymenobacter aquaticus]